MTHICVSKFTIIGSDNGLSSSRPQIIIWTNSGILLTLPLGTNFSEIVSKIGVFSFRKMHFKIVVYEIASILSRSKCADTFITPNDVALVFVPWL